METAVKNPSAEKTSVFIAIDMKNTAGFSILLPATNAIAMRSIAAYIPLRDPDTIYPNAMFLVLTGDII